MLELCRMKVVSNALDVTRQVVHVGHELRSPTLDRVRISGARAQRVQIQREQRQPLADIVV